jgi:UDP:flavonoid glycosyltransferase YjiC (YdhE family)
MRIVLAPSGSRGDVQPMVALALRLKGHGYRVVMCGAPAYQPLVCGYGVEFQRTSIDASAYLTQYSPAMTGGRLSGFRSVRMYLRQELAEQFRTLQGVCEGASCVIGTGSQFAAQSIAEFLRLPYRAMVYTPQLLPSPAHPPPMRPWFGLPPAGNRLAWFVTRVGFNAVLRPAINRERARLGLEPIVDVWRYWITKDPFLAFDPELVDGSLGDFRQPTGAWHLDEDDSVLSPEIIDFLDAGPPPVYVGFSSMPRDQSRDVCEAVTRAAQDLGIRLMLGDNYGGDIPQGTTSTMTVTNAPHLALFRRVAAVVHHGGAGTTAAALRAAVPQVIVPFAFDQLDWGKRVARLGVGVNPILRKNVTYVQLKAALERVVSDDSMHTAALRVGEQVRKRDALTPIVDEIEALCKGSA